MTDPLRELLARHAGLSADTARTVGEDDDLYAAGMTSFATVQLMLAIEERFDMEFPEARLNSRTFATLRSLRTVLDEAGVRQAA